MKVKKAKTDGEWIRQMVWEGEFGFTASGLEKKDLVIKNGKIISKQVSENGKTIPGSKLSPLPANTLISKGSAIFERAHPCIRRPNLS